MSVGNSQCRPPTPRSPLEVAPHHLVPASQGCRFHRGSPGAQLRVTTRAEVPGRPDSPGRAAWGHSQWRSRSAASRVTLAERGLRFSSLGLLLAHSRHVETRALWLIQNHLKRQALHCGIKCHWIANRGVAGRVLSSRHTGMSGSLRPASARAVPGRPGWPVGAAGSRATRRLVICRSYRSPITVDKTQGIIPLSVSSTYTRRLLWSQLRTACPDAEKCSNASIGEILP